MSVDPNSGGDPDPTTSPSGQFTFSGLRLPEDEDPLGIWQLTPRASTERAPGTAFATSEEAEPPEVGLRWRIELPAGSRQARSELSSRLALARARTIQLDVVEGRLSQLGATQSYHASSGPEADLLVEVAALWGSATAYAEGHDSAVSYGLITDKAQELLLQFRRLIQYYARVETTVGGRILALTTIDWSGDYQTLWQDDVADTDMTLHLDAVKLALSSRQALIRLVSVVTAGALSLAAKASVPGGQILLLPAVYDYVRDVLEELGAYAQSRGLYW